MIFHIKGYTPKATLSALILHLLLSSPAYSFEIKGVALGASVEDVKRVHSEVDCNTLMSELELVLEKEYIQIMGDQYCDISNTTIAGSRISWGMDFYENRMWRARSKDMDTVFYERVRDALIKKFGEPNSITLSILQNAFGARFTNQIAVWENENAKMRIERYANNKITTMSLDIRSKEGEAIMESRLKEYQGSTKPDI